MSMQLSPRIIHGSLHPANKSACHWGWQGYIAYGCQNFVVVIDSKTAQVVQTLQNHAAPICNVKWHQENYYHDLHSPYDLKLAAANTSGYILIWDIRAGILIKEFVESTKQPICMEWLTGHDVSHDLLLVLYQPNLMILWNADTGIKLWKKSFTDNILQMTIDPFNNSNMTVMSSDWIMFVTDLSLNQPPSEKGRKFFMSNNASSPSSSSNSIAATGTSSGLNKSLGNQTRSTIQRLRSVYGDLRGGNNSGRTEDETDSNCDCLQIAYLKANRNHVLLLFPREILILDMEIGQALGSFSIENSSPSFQAVYPCQQRDILFLLHENGSISMRAIRTPSSIPYEEDDDPENVLSMNISLDIVYDIKCHSDVFRLSRASRLMGFCVDPVHESNNVIILGDGRTLFWSLSPPSGKSTFHKEPITWRTLPDLNEVNRFKNESEQISLNEMVPCLMSFINNKHKSKFYKPRFVLSGMLESIALNPVCCKMCPPMTTRNFSNYRPLLAIGCNNGILQIFNLSQGSLVKHLMMTTHSIKGLEWISLTSLLVWFHGSSTNNKSEIAHVDINTGQIKTLPSSRGLKESTVASLKISQLKNYFLVLFKNKSAELWDASNLCQLREFPGNFPTITAFGWSPASYSSKFGKKKNKSNAPKDAASAPDFTDTSNVLDSSVNKEAAKKQAKMKEHLVFTDTDGTVYHYVVEGTSLKDGSKVPPEAGMGTISYIAWKQEVLVLGDVDGNVNFWDLKGKVSRVFPTNRGPIRRLKFAPGKGNMRILMLFSDGVDIWDSIEARSLANIKTSKDSITIADADWLSSSLPVLLLSDGSARVMDPGLTSANSPIEEKDYEEALFNPRLLSEPSESLKMKSILQHQKWRDNYDPVNYSEDRRERSVQNLLTRMPSETRDRLDNCPLGTAERCTKVAQLYGDEADTTFWNVALHYLEKEKIKKKLQADSAETPQPEKKKSFDLEDFELDIDLDDDDEDVENFPPSKDQTSFLATCTELDSCYDILCDNEFYRRTQLFRMALRDSHRSSYEHTRSCAENLILLGKMDRAVQILLEGEPTDASYYPDALRACLIATVKTCSNSQSTIKLVATNLIACGKIKEGVELLCLVDKGVDACRYLQTYGGWNLSTWIAKVRLNQRDCTDVMSRYSEHLSSTMNRKMDAILILLSFGEFIKVMEMLFKLGQVDRAVLLLESCIEFGLLSLDDDTNRNLFENILLDYARFQIKLKNDKAVEYYCQLAGGRGVKLMDEHRANSSTAPASPTPSQ